MKVIKRKGEPIMNNIYITIDKNPNSPHRAILAHIPTGADNAVSMKDLARVLGEDQRTVRLQIEKARLDRNIIASTDQGYFIPETESELREYVRRSWARIKTSYATLAPALTFLGDFFDDTNE